GATRAAAAPPLHGRCSGRQTFKWSETILTKNRRWGGKKALAASKQPAPSISTTSPVTVFVDAPASCAAPESSLASRLLAQERGSPEQGTPSLAGRASIGYCAAAMTGRENVSSTPSRKG